MVLGVWLVACGPEPIQFVEPFDGSSGVLPQDPLVVHLDERYPEGEPVPDDVIEVVDLEDGGRVAGSTAFVDGAVVFVPDLPWTVGDRYAWAVSAPLPRPRAPLIELPPGLAGEASFRVGGERALLDASIADGELCLLFSDDVDDIPRLRLGDLELVDPRTEARDLELPGRRAPGTARCLALPDGVASEPGVALVRAWDREGATTAAPLSDTPLAERWRARHRWVEP